MERVPFGKFGFISKTTVDWVYHHMSAVFGGITVIVLAAIWSLYQWNSGSPRDYFTAETTFNQWNGTHNEQLIKLQKLLKLHPELRAKYDGRIAQKLLLSSEQGLAASFSRSVLKRTGNFSLYYTQFSHCSLLIGEKKFQEALVLAKTVKQSLDQDHQFWETKSEFVKHGQILYGYNLLRIAFLQQALGNSLGEMEAWKEFKECAGWVESDHLSNRSDQQAYELICQNFQKNATSLKDFVQYRERALKPSEEN